MEESYDPTHDFSHPGERQRHAEERDATEEHPSLLLAWLPLGLMSPLQLPSLRIK